MAGRCVIEEAQYDCAREIGNSIVDHFHVEAAERRLDLHAKSFLIWQAVRLFRKLCGWIYGLGCGSASILSIRASLPVIRMLPQSNAGYRRCVLGGNHSN